MEKNEFIEKVNEFKENPIYKKKAKSYRSGFNDALSFAYQTLVDPNMVIVFEEKKWIK